MSLSSDDPEEPRSLACSLMTSCARSRSFFSSPNEVAVSVCLFGWIGLSRPSGSELVLLECIDLFFAGWVYDVGFLAEEFLGGISGEFDLMTIDDGKDV